MKLTREQIEDNKLRINCIFVGHTTSTNINKCLTNNTFYIGTSAWEPREITQILVANTQGKEVLGFKRLSWTIITRNRKTYS